MRIGIFVVAALIMLAPSLSSADQSPETGNVPETSSCRTPESDRPTIGLVLGGGGARGSAHIGVIKALQELRVPVDCVVGTSMGSLVGALYATGMSVEEMEQTIGAIDWQDLFIDETPREDQPYRRKRDDEVFALFGPKIGIGRDTSLISTGLISGQKISFLFESLVSERVQVTHFDQLPLPFRAVAADLLTGDAVVIEEGSLALAMRASMSVPAVFDPVEWDDKLLVDGGIADNLPVDVARQMGADVIIAVDVGAGGLEREQIKNVLSVVGQLTNLMIMGNVEASRESLTENDVLIKPALGREISSASFARSSEAAAIGYTSTMEEREAVESISLPEAQYADYVAAVDRTTATAPTIEFVRIDNRSQFSDDLILRQLNIEMGKPLDREQLETDIRLIYGLGFLEMVRYEVIEEGDQRGLELYVRQDARGTHYLEWGLDLFADDLTNGFNLRLGYLKTDLDELGSELRVAAQFGREELLVFDLYKYIDRSAKTFVIPRLFAEDREFTEFVDGEAESVSRINQYGADFALGREFSRHAALSAGIRAYTGDVESVIGDATIDDEEYDAGEYFVDWTYDRLNDRYFPDNGNFARIGYWSSADWLGSDDDYDQLSMAGVFVKSFGPHTILGAVGVDATVGGEAPRYALFSGGGLYSLAGFNPGEIAGPNFGVVSGSYQFRIARGFVPTRLGFSVEYGGVADDWEDLFDEGVVHGSVFAGFRTPIGPGYLGYGFGEGGASRWFLKFGRVFGSPSVTR
jgi:NTE family protein